MKVNKNFKVFFVVFVLLLLAGVSTILFKKNVSYSAGTIMKYEDMIDGTFVPFDTVVTVAQKHSGTSSESYGHTYIIYCSGEISKDDCINKLYDASYEGYGYYDWSEMDTEFTKHVRLDEGSSSTIANYSDLFNSSDSYIGWEVIKTSDVGDDKTVYSSSSSYVDYYNNATAGIALYPTTNNVEKEDEPSLSNDYEICVKCNANVPKNTTWYKFTPINFGIYDSSDNLVVSGDSSLNENSNIDFYDFDDYESYYAKSENFNVLSGQIVSFRYRGSHLYPELYYRQNENSSFNSYGYLSNVDNIQQSLYSTYKKEVDVDAEMYITFYLDSYYGNYVGIKEYGVLTPINEGPKLDKTGLSSGDIIYYVSECNSGLKWDDYFYYTAPVTYSVIYNDNGATEGTVPIDNEVYLGGSNYTILGNTGNLKKNTSAFAGWSKSVISEIINEANDAVLEPGSIETIVDSDVNLYAVYCVDENQNGICDYKENKYSVIYDKGIGTGSVPIDGNKYLTGINYTVKGNTGNLKATNAIFDGWSSTLINEVITSRYEGVIEPGTVKQMSDSNITYYALYCADINNNDICDYKEDKYRVNYYGALATTGNPPIDNNSYLSGLSYRVKGNTGNLDMVKATFDGWSTTELTEIVTERYAGTIDPDAVVTMGTSNVAYYAIFAEDINENEIADYKEDRYSVIYHENIATSGTVPVDSNRYLTKLTAKVLDNTGELKLDKAIFIGWAKEELGLLTEKDTTHKIYTKDNSIIITDSDINLNAVFCADTNENDICDYNEDGYSVIYDKNTATSGEVPVDNNKYLEKYTYRVKGNEGNLDANNATFVGWSLNELPIIKEYDDSIVDPDTEIKMGKSDVLYFAVLAEDINNNEIADYLEDRYTVTYDGNGATSGNVPVDNNKYLTLLSYEVMDNIGNLSKDNAKFVGWSTTKLEDSTEIPNDLVQPGTTNTIKDSSIVYYAVWQKNEEVKNPNTKSFVIWAIVSFISISLVLVTILNKKIVKYE